MVKKYSKYCKFCGEEISWFKTEQGKWQALNLDISEHFCEGFTKVKIIHKDSLPLDLIKQYEEGMNK